MGVVDCVVAPFSDEQIEAINAYQKLGYVHELTCAVSHPPEKSKILYATKEGMRCPSCKYLQNWVHRFIANTSSHPKKPEILQP